MTKRLFAILLLLLVTHAVHADDSEILQKVESSARSWLEFVDRGQYQESWENSSPLLRTKIPEAVWIKSLTTLRSSRGAINTRFIATAGATKSLSGFPDGDYVVLQFYTTFTGKGLILETVTLVKAADESWQVCDYVIK
ncbi:MAG: DUF4019 domain-containing protein [Nitrosomonas sp.]|nr:DUF4019 domain-containing protein [Nitrosomonas sp.]